MIDGRGTCPVCGIATCGPHTELDRPVVDLTRPTPVDPSAIAAAQARRLEIHARRAARATDIAERRRLRGE